MSKTPITDAQYRRGLNSIRRTQKKLSHLRRQLTLAEEKLDEMRQSHMKQIYGIEIGDVLIENDAPGCGLGRLIAFSFHEPASVLANSSLSLEVDKACYLLGIRVETFGRGEEDRFVVHPAHMKKIGTFDWFYGTVTELNKE